MYVDRPHHVTTAESPYGRRYPNDARYAVGSPGNVTAAKVLLVITAGFLGLNLFYSLAQSASLPAVSYLIVIGLTVLVAVAAAKVRQSRAWGLGGGSVGIALAGLMVVLTMMVSDLRISESLKSSVNSTLLIGAAIYGGLGLTVIVLLNTAAAREYYDSY